MNSQEQRFLNAMYDHAGADAFVVGDKVGFSSGQVNYYLSKWRQRGWYDTENEVLTDAAPPRTETMRSQLEKQGFNPLDRSRKGLSPEGLNSRVDDVPAGFASTDLPDVDQSTIPVPRWGVVVAPDYDGFISFLERRGVDGHSWLHARNSQQLTECLEKFDRHMKVVLGPRWYHSDISEAWLEAKGIHAEVLV